MEMSNAAVGAIAALCVTAGAAGVYVATERPGTRITPIESAAAIAPSDAAMVYQPTPQPVAAVQPASRAARLAPAPAVRRAAAAPERRSEPANSWTIDTPAEPEVRQPSAATTWSPVENERVDTARRTASAAPEFIELMIPADSVLGLQIESALTSETAELEDQVVARVTRDLRVSDRVAIPSGALAHGEVTLVERGGKLRERARLGVRFTSVVLADGTRISLSTDTIIREGSSPGGESAAKIGGGAVGGAIIGGIVGGARGALIGGSVGAGAGTAAVLAGGRNPAAFPAGASITARLVEPIRITQDY